MIEDCSKHAHWVQETPRLYILQCELGQCTCIAEPCLFYEEEKDESKRTDKNPADNTESE